ncbi:MAG: hypothetical protein D6820_04880, partial [Lentisphaerae bacterium]
MPDISQIQQLTGKEVYPHSLHDVGTATLAMVHGTAEDQLVCIAPTATSIPSAFPGLPQRCHEHYVACAPLHAETAEFLRQHFPWTAPSSLAQQQTTIGCGDRLGVAGRG